MQRLEPRHRAVIAVVTLAVAGAATLWWGNRPANGTSTAAETSAKLPSESTEKTPEKTAKKPEKSPSNTTVAKQEGALHEVTLDPSPTALDDAPDDDDWRSETQAETLSKRVAALVAAAGRHDAVGVAAMLTDPALMAMGATTNTKQFAGTTTRHYVGSAVKQLPAMQAAKGLIRHVLDDPKQVVRTKIDRLEATSKPIADVRVTLVVAGRERHALWTIMFDDSRPPKVRSIEVDEDRETARPAPLFADATGHVLSKIPEPARSTLLADADTWLRSIDRSLPADPIGHQGLAVGDFNGDGRDDVYVCAPAGVPNRLLIQQPDGTVVDEAQKYGVALLDLSRSALVIDLDNDGDQDLLVATRGADSAEDTSVLLFEGNGAAAFGEPDEVLRGGDIHSMAAADFDNDGDLDVYLCALNASRRLAGGVGVPIPYHDARNGGRNVLLQNIGGLRLRDVTLKTGLDKDNSRWSYAAAWQDYDNDGDPDLYVANDFGRNNLYRNDKGRFVDVAAMAGVEDLSSGMSVSWGDVDGDGHSDLYVSNMYSAAGRRITGQPSFQKAASQRDRAGFARHARGNTLFRNRGDGTFEDVSAAAGTMVAKWAWGSLIADLNGDGRKDIAVVNGMFTRTDPGDL